MHFKVNAIIPAGGTSSRFGNKNKLLEKIYVKEVIKGGEASGMDIENTLNTGKEVIKGGEASGADIENTLNIGKEVIKGGEASGADIENTWNIGKEVIKYTVEAFEASNVDEIIICANKNIIEDLNKIFQNSPKVKIIEGGATRQASVYNGLKACECDYVLIHDGARPMISTELVNRTIEMVKEKKALTVATKTVDTIKEVVDGKIIRTIDRSRLYNTQTPQAFEYNLIKQAHEKLYGQNFTDDAGMLEQLGETVYILDGSYKNIKITTQNDIAIASVYLEQQYRGSVV